MPQVVTKINKLINKTDVVFLKQKKKKKGLLVIKLCSMHQEWEVGLKWCVYVCVGRGHPNYKNV